MKLDKLIYSIKEALKDYSDDSNLDDRYIAFLVDAKRAMLLSQKLNSYTTKIPSRAIQTFCIEIEDASRYSCEIDIACDKIRRSVKPLPKMFDTVIGNSLIKVNPTDILGKPFKVIDSSLVPYVEYSSYNNSIFAFTDDDNYLYIYSTGVTHKLIDCVEVKGIFESPLALEDFKNCCGDDCETTEVCFSMDKEYPIPAEMVDIIKNAVIQDLVKLKDIKEDRENDSASED